MELKDAIFTTLYIFAILMVVVLTVSYISFRIKKKREGNLEAHERLSDVTATGKPKLVIKSKGSNPVVENKTSSKKAFNQTGKSHGSTNQREKDKSRRSDEDERVRGRERIKEERRREKERMRKKLEEREKHEEIKHKEFKKNTRDNRIQVINPGGSSESSGFGEKAYSRPLTPLNPKTSRSKKSYSDNDDQRKDENFSDRYTDENSSPFYAPKFKFRDNDNEK